MSCLRRIAEQLRELAHEPQPRGFFAERALPDGDDVPAETAEGGFVAEVAGLVAGYLGLPPIDAGFWQAEGGAMFVAVPEVAVDEDDGVVFRQDSNLRFRHWLVRIL